MTKRDFWRGYKNRIPLRDYQRLLKRTRYYMSCIIWTGDVSTDGSPKFRVNGQYRAVKLHLMRILMRVNYNGRSYSTKTLCGHLKCVNPEHLVVIKKAVKYLSPETKKMLKELMTKYSIPYLSRYYKISKVILNKVKNES